MEKEQKEEDKKIPSKKKNTIPKIDKEFYWIVGVIIGLIALFLIAGAVFQNLKSFEYQGLTYTKEKVGDIQLYRYSYFTEVPSITGQAVSDPFEVNLYLRNDPRENNVPLEGKIFFRREQFVYISVNSTGLQECEYSLVSVSNLAAFFGSNGYEARGGTPDQTEAKETNGRYVTCENRPNHPVILIQKGEETKITKEDNCHIISVNNCEILPAVEKFMTQTILDAKERNL